MKRTIGGTLNYATLASLNRTRDVEAVRAAVHELAARGMGDHDIARALELDVQQVRRIVAEHQ